MFESQEKPISLGRVALAVALMAGVGACTASPRYPIDARQAPGEGGLTPWQPRYPISARDAAENARDAADGSAVPASSNVNPPPPPAAPRVQRPAAADDDTPRALPNSGVDSSDLPPPSAMPHLMSEMDVPSMPPGLVLADYRVAEGGAPELELAAYHHRRHRKAKVKTDTEPADQVARKTRHAPHLRGVEGDDSPYQTTVRSGEKLADVAKRMNTTRDALIQLNDIKHPRHIHAGTVLKAPYRYSYEVQKGDTLYTVARRFSQDPEAVAKLNGLKHAAALQPGQTIQLPPNFADQGVRRHAAAEALKPEAAPERMIQAALQRAELEDRRRAKHAHKLETAEETPGRHRRGDTEAAEVAADAAASDTSNRHSRRAASQPPATYNPPPAIARSGPAATSVATAPPIATAGTSSADTSSPVATVRPAASPSQVATLNTPTYRPPSTPGSPYAPSLGRARTVEPELNGGAMSGADIAQAGRGRFVWPLHGPLVSGFGDHGAQHNDGMDISVQAGDSVHAAAAGEVVYAGSSIPGFGNLVLVKHSGGWVTAYAHLDRIEVRMRDEVTQGEEIGQAGQTGAVDRPLLHFEVRYAPQPTDKARPVDPALVLPAG